MTGAKVNGVAHHGPYHPEPARKLQTSLLDCPLPAPEPDGNVVPADDKEQD